ncbi:hypothetical protein GPZ77_34710 (plasmid) [Streptomyces sp. QHH-9511]|uniref:hypothetical protein n=1 Tax=Streptomyces sp. QHH-9511 TaxID=2684468 RepID=UPI00131829B4|nr:hypothetical protein [Streptomyces sp. QHH-9511]QGZ53380.1 hypothetical protein GPZ77_34710 [Streptomyces sp. QHH-9511]
MDPTTVTLVGALVAFSGALAGAVVAFVGKRGELSLSSLTTLTDELQEERSNLKEERATLKAEVVEKTAALVAKDAALAEAAAARATAEAEITRLRLIIVQLGGDPG